MNQNFQSFYLDSSLENKRQRAEFLLKAKDDVVVQAQLKEACARDFLFWLYNFGWTYNPRLKKEKYIPFIPYKFQVDYMLDLINDIKTAKDGETSGVEKCRDMGVSWMVLCVFYWFWLFHANSDFLVGSRKESLVDKQKHPDTLFGKLDILIRRTPQWMLPKGFNPQRHNTHMSLMNPELGSLIKGESANADFSRSGRYKAVLMDELAFWQNAAPAYSAASESCNLIIPVSTPNPEGSGFFKYLVDNKDRYKFTRLEHTLHPHKGPEWLKEQYQKKSAETIAVEILIDYQGAITGKVYSSIMKVDVNAKWDYDPRLPLYRAWDFGHGGADPTVILWLQKDFETNQVRLIDCYSKGYEDINYFAPIALGKKAITSEFIYNEDDLEEMERRKGWKFAVDYGDPYSLKQTQINTTIQRELSKHGINVQIPDKLGSVMDRIDKARMLVKRLVVHPRAWEVIETIARSRFPDSTGNSTQPRNKPIHDDTSHYRTALEYFADMEPMGDSSKDEEMGERAAQDYLHHVAGRRRRSVLI